MSALQLSGDSPGCEVKSRMWLFPNTRSSHTKNKDETSNALSSVHSENIEQWAAYVKTVILDCIFKIKVYLNKKL